MRACCYTTSTRINCSPTSLSVMIMSGLVWFLLLLSGDCIQCTSGFAGPSCFSSIILRRTTVTNNNSNNNNNNNRKATTTTATTTTLSRSSPIKGAPIELNNKLSILSSSSLSSSCLFGTRGGATTTTTTTNRMLSSDFFKTVLPKITMAASTAFAVIFHAIMDLTALQKVLFVSVFSIGVLVGKIRPFWKPFRDINNIPANYFGPDAPILRGRAVSVSDGDTIRFYHTPILSLKRFNPNQKLKVSQVALPIRICTIDTPETPKFGKPGQPFGKEAKQVLKELLQNRLVKIKMLQKDQYSRAVAQVYVDRPLFRRTYVDQYMLEKGMAEVYEGGGAVYGPLGKEKYRQLQEEAQSHKLGIWSKGKRESAAEYKKRTKD